MDRFDLLTTEDGLDVLIPMKAVGTDKPTIVKAKNDPANYLGDIKVDGHYLCAYIGFGGEYDCRLFTRNVSVSTGVFTERTEELKPIAELLGDLSCIGQMIIPGELVHKDGKDSIPSVMNSLPKKCWDNQKRLGLPIFAAFDLIFYDTWIGDQPLEIRKHMLSEIFDRALFGTLSDMKQTIFPTGTHTIKRIATEEDINIPLSELFTESIDCGFEGAVYKRRNSLYIPGYISNDKVRIRGSKDWLKHKVKREYDVVILRFTEAKEGKTGQFLGMVGAVVFGQYKEGKLIEIGQASGMDVAVRKDMTDNHESYIGKVCIVEAQQRSSKNDRLRHAQYKGLRGDKTPEECIYDEDEC